MPGSRDQCVHVIKKYVFLVCVSGRLIKHMSTGGHWQVWAAANV